MASDPVHAAGDQHTAVAQQGRRVAHPRRRRGAGRAERAGRRVVDLGGLRRRIDRVLPDSVTFELDRATDDEHPTVRQRVAVCQTRGMVIDPVAVKVPVAGSNSSASAVGIPSSSGSGRTRAGRRDG